MVRESRDLIVRSLSSSVCVITLVIFLTFTCILESKTAAVIISYMLPSGCLVYGCLRNIEYENVRFCVYDKLSLEVLIT